MKFQWKPHARKLRKLDVQAVGDELEQLREKNGGRLTPADVVEAARRRRSAMHKAFTWNNDAAADAYRLVEAQHLLRSIEVRVTVETPGKPTKVLTRLYVHNEPTEKDLLDDPDAEPAYTSIQTVLTDADATKQLLAKARRDIQIYKRKYVILRTLAHFDTLFDAIDDLLESAE